MADVKTSRRAKAAATRSAIVRAAHAEFLEQGFHGATIAAIARRAGVAAQTVYFVFHTKPELISAVVDTAVMGDGDPVPPDQQPWWQEMREEPDAAETLRRFVRGAAPVLARTSAVAEVLRAAAATDPELRRTHETHERLQRVAWSEVLDLLARKGTLRGDLTRDQLLDVFLVTFGDAAFQLYVVEHGWTSDQVVDWMCRTLPALLLAQPPVSARRQRPPRGSRSGSPGRSTG